MPPETTHTPACPLCKTPLSQPNRLGMSNTHRIGVHTVNVHRQPHPFSPQRYSSTLAVLLRRRPKHGKSSSARRSPDSIASHVARNAAYATSGSSSPAITSPRATSPTTQSTSIPHYTNKSNSTHHSHEVQKPSTLTETILGNVLFVLFMMCFVALELHNVGKTNWPGAFIAGTVLMALSYFFQTLGHDKLVALLNITIIIGSVFHYLYNLLFV